MSVVANWERLRWIIGDVVLDEGAMELHCAGQLVDVEPKPLELLMFLLRRVGEVVTRDEILEELWPGRIVTDSVITNCVGKLRAAINDQEQSVVVTVPRFGYRLKGEVRREVISPVAPQPSNALGLAAGDELPQRPQWRLERQLSSGAHGEVWLAQGEQTREQRVIKFGRDAESLAAIKREITLYRVLRETLGSNGEFLHLLGWNLQQQPYFIEVEYSPLGNLVDWCQQQGGVQSLPLELRVELAARCAAAVAAVHSAGVLHKDLKPSNIIMIAGKGGGQPRPHLCDFATSRVADPELLRLLSITRLGFTQTLASPDSSGTPQYLAPEVIAGQPLTALADIYALGVMLYQLVVGDFKRPFAPGWEREVDDPLLREDISLAASGDPRRRLSDAGQLAFRLRSLRERHAELEAQRRNAQEAEEARRMLQRAQARRGLLLTLIGVLVVAGATIVKLYLELRTACGTLP